MTDWRERRDIVRTEEARNIAATRLQLAAEIEQARVQQSEAIASTAVKGMARLSRMIDVMCEPNTDTEFTCREIADTYLLRPSNSLYSPHLGFLCVCDCKR